MKNSDLELGSSPPTRTQRERYSGDFKREAVGLTRLPEANVSQIAEDLGIRTNQIHRWRRDFEMDLDVINAPP